MPFPYTSVMIEVNKHVYMNERTLRLESEPRKWMRWAGTVERIYEFLMQEQQIPNIKETNLTSFIRERAIYGNNERTPDTEIRGV